MAQLSVSSSEWTQIVPPGGTEDMVIRLHYGSCLVSLGAANADGAVTMVMPPVPPTPSPLALVDEMRAAAGIAVYAKAIREPTLANASAEGR
jgi:hypothetical protein